MLRRPFCKMIFYRPGMISLLVLPFILQQRIKKIADTPRLHFLQVNMPNLKNSTAFFYVGNIPKRKNQEIYLTKYSDEMKIETRRLIARRLKNENDTINGLKFVFTTTCTYGTYVSVLSMCKEEYLKYYAQVEDSLLIYMCSP